MVQNNIQTGARGRNAGHKTVVGIHTFWANMKWSKKNWQKRMAFDFDLIRNEDKNGWMGNTNPLKHEFQQYKIYKFSFQFTGRTLSLYYKDQPLKYI
jgi:hypothetical protein